MRSIDPIVSTEWLYQNRDNRDLIIIDIRSREEYLAGHIPAALNLPFTGWIANRNGLQLQLPDDSDLQNVLKSAGITPSSLVVVVNKTDNPFPLADADRVADTLIWCRVENAAVLDGGSNKWVKEKKELSSVTISPKPAEIYNAVDRSLIVDKNYVRARIGKSIILDARDPASYYGANQEATAARRGHIPTAKCLPSPWIWTAEGTYKNLNELRPIAASAAGEAGSQEIIVYCGVGGYASAWWFVLTQMLGYRNVKYYNGSAQDWTRDPELPVVTCKWE
jgi:thiosulfate/3-mercaptopyruvate sulfurtransferase